MADFVLVHWFDRDAAYRNRRYWMAPAVGPTIDIRVVEAAALASDGKWVEVWVQEYLGDATAPAGLDAFLRDYAVGEDGLARRTGTLPPEEWVRVTTRPEPPRPALPVLDHEPEISMAVDASGILRVIGRADYRRRAEALGFLGHPAAVEGLGDGGEIVNLVAFEDPVAALEYWQQAYIEQLDGKPAGDFWIRAYARTADYALYSADLSGLADSMPITVADGVEVKEATLSDLRTLAAWLNWDDACRWMPRTYDGTEAGSVCVRCEIRTS